MPFSERGFEHSDKVLDREDRNKPLSPAERVALVQEKYLTPDGKGNELFATLCLRYLNPVVIRILGETYISSVEDVVQVAAFNASRFLNKFDGRASLQTWLFRVGSNAALTFITRMKVRKDISEGDSPEDLMKIGEDIADPKAEDNARENAEILEDVLGILDAHQKHILILHHVEGYGSKEIAAMLDMNENTIKVQLHRARQAMIKYANKEGLKIFNKKS